jgi:hypothetical protein
VKGHLGLVDRSEDLRSRLDFPGDPRDEYQDPIGNAWVRRWLLSPSLGACIVRRTLGSIAGLALVIALLSGFVALYLAKGPIALSGMGARITRALDEKVGHGYSFRVGPVSLTAHGFGPTLAINNLTLVDQSGEPIISAPRAEVSVDMVDLLFGKVAPKRLEIFGIEVRLELLRDGSLAVSAGGGRQAATPLLPLAAGIGTIGEAQSQAAPESAPPIGPALANQTAGLEKSAVPPRSLAVKRIGAALRLLIDASTRSNSPLAALDKVGISHGRLVIADRAAEESRVYQGLNLAFDKAGNGTNFSLSADGPNGVWSVSASSSGVPTSTRRLDIETKNISIDEILLVAGSRKLGADFDMPVSSKFTMALAPDGGLTEIVGGINLGSGYLRFDDPNDEPRLIDSIDTAFHWDRTNRQIAIDEIRLRTGGSNFAFKGAVAPPVREGEAWLIELANSGVETYGAERPGEAPITLTRFDIGARVNLPQKTLTLDQFSFSGPDCNFAMRGLIDWINGPRIRIAAAIGQTQARTAVRLWPSFAVAPLRSWFLSHWKAGVIDKGTLRLDFDGPMIKAMRLQHAPPDKNFAMDFDIHKGAIEFLPGAPLLQNIEGASHITGRTSTFTAAQATLDAGSGGPLSVTQGIFQVANAEMKPTPAKVSAQVSGSVEAVSALLSYDALKPYASLPVDPKTLRGKIVGAVGFAMQLGPVMRPEDFQLAINATATDLVAEHLIGKESLEDATLTTIVDASGMKAKGQGRLFGGPATIDIERPIGKPTTAAVSVILDDAARAKQGFGSLSNVHGPILVKVNAPLGVPPPVKANVELDLTHAAISGIPGFSKAAGRPGKVSFTLGVDDNGTTLDQVAVDAAPVQIRGSVQLAADQSLVSAKFSQLRLSQGDDVRAEILKSGDGWKVNLRATTMDARPFLRNLTFAKADQTGAADPADDKDKDKDVDKTDKDVAPGKDIEIDLKATTLTGYNKTVLSGAELHMAKNGETLRQFEVSGKFGHAEIAGQLNNPTSPSPQLDLTTSNAGALLAFLDLYQHMDGGQLQVALRLGNDALAGTLKIKDFLLRDEPALRRLAVEGAQQRPIGMEGAAATSSEPNFDPNAVAFSRLQVNFQRAGSRLDIRDGTMYGTEMGLSVDGWLDFARDRVSMDGTFVPAYGVNNLFSQVPLFGPLLGGGSHEGLFAVNFNIAGAASRPTLNIKPLTAIAPGFLRKIFGAIDLSSPQSSGTNSFAEPTQP